MCLSSLLLGMFLCGVYDIFRISRLGGRAGVIIVFICDIAFSAITVASLLLLFFNLSFGRVRVYALAIVLLGFLLWRFTVSRVYIALCIRIIKLIERILNSIKMRVKAVLNRLFRLIYTKLYCLFTIKSAKNGFGKGK